MELELGYLKVTVLAMHLLTSDANFKDFLASVTTSWFLAVYMTCWVNCVVLHIFKEAGC